LKLNLLFRPQKKTPGPEFQSPQRRAGWFLLGISAGLVGGSLIFRLARGFSNLLQQPRLISRAVVRLLGDDEKLEDLALEIASDNLRGGLEKRLLPSGETKTVLVAGMRNFREPWARDFGFASRGLMVLEEAQAVRECLDVFLQFQKADGQFPVKIHSTTVPHRYLHSLFQREQPVSAPIRPKYYSGHRTLSLDGNALIITAALNYARTAGDREFIHTHWKRLIQGTTWLEKHASLPDGLLHQGPYSDWADSINRQGRVLYTNVLYWKAAADMADAAVQYEKREDQQRLRAKAELLKESINEHFWRSDLGYFVTSSLFSNLSSSGNLMAIAWGLADEEQAKSILKAMEQYGMADPVPTKPVHRPYPLRYVALENRLGGIGHYHTEAAWLWLGAWHVIALAKTGRMDEAQELLDRMSNVIVRDGQVHEVYGTDGKFLSTRLYTSEAPLTWSAGMFVYAYDIYRELQRNKSKDGEVLQEETTRIGQPGAAAE
jgi:glycogen debranching enzyme